MKTVKQNTLVKILLLFTPVLLVIGGSSPASAITVNYNNLINDGMFDSYNSMSASQIDAFLNSFPNSCISTNKGFSAVDPTGYNPTNGFLYGSRVSAGRVIYDAAQAYEINPQVLLATIQKEQGYVSGPGYYDCSNPTSSTAKLGYTQIVGYGCPDGGTTYNYSGVSPALYYINGSPITSVSGTCVKSSSAAGFTQQIIRAAWLLKFDRMRSEGKINWAIIKGNWDNSDDLDTTYYGYMTQGTWQRCSSCAATYYDGYATIDSTSIHMDNGATASLYVYTPHKSGNSNFVTIFTNWFGSTQLAQPVGGSLYRQSSNGKLYLAQTNTDNTVTRYYLSSWSIMQNYGLDKYPLIPADDSTINSMTDGGTLTNLIRDSNGNVYLVNNQVKHYISSSSICTAWGFDCFNSAVTHTLSSDFESVYLGNGGSLGLLMHDTNNIYYKMESGTKRPFANYTSVTDSGYSRAEALPANITNTTQPLGKLIITTPGMIKFSPKYTFYYFDGSSFYSVGSMAAYNAWKLSGVASLTVPESSYNQADNPLIAGTLGLYYTDGSSKYLIDSGRKIKLASSQEPYWTSATFVNAPAYLANRLATIGLGSFIKAGYNFYLLSPTSHTKNYIPTLSDYYSLGGNNSNTTRISTDLASSVSDGPVALANADLVKIDSGYNIYAVYNNQLLLVASLSVLNSYGFNFPIAHYSSSLFKSSYPLIGTLVEGKSTGGDIYIPDGNKLLTLDGGTAQSFGVKLSNFTTIDSSFIKNASKQTITCFLRDRSNGAIYYGSGGAIHYVTSYDSFARYGGTTTPVTSLDHQFINDFVIAQPI